MGGSSVTPRKPNGNIDWEKVYSIYLKKILDNQIAPNTGRGLMYILKSKQILVKSDYNQLVSHLKDWRKEGRIRWDQIADGSGRGIINDFSDYQSPDESISCIKSLRYGGDVYRRYLMIHGNGEDSHIMWRYGLKSMQSLGQLQRLLEIDMSKSHTTKETPDGDICTITVSDFKENRIHSTKMANKSREKFTFTILETTISMVVIWTRKSVSNSSSLKSQTL